MGFGHRVYKNYDPRAKIIKKMADQVFEVTGKNPLLDIALELERIALQDDYFVSASSTPTSISTRGSSTRRWASRSDHVPGAVRHSAHGRLAGAVGGDAARPGDQKIARPRQVYTGSEQRDYVPMEERDPQARRKATTG